MLIHFLAPKEVEVDEDALLLEFLRQVVAGRRFERSAVLEMHGCGRWRGATWNSSRPVSPKPEVDKAMAPHE